jgi:hypothetical protein
MSRGKSNKQAANELRRRYGLPSLRCVEIFTRRLKGDITLTQREIEAAKREILSIKLRGNREDRN